jgi:hypothetical protein
MLALVWIAGPLSGVLVQPYVGLKSDNCRLRWGKRRPFIVGGAAATILSLMVLAWAKEIMGGFLGLFGADPESTGVRTSIMLFAVMFVYVLDFAINVSKCFATSPRFRVQSSQSTSSSRCPSLYCRRRTYPSTRIRQRVVDAICRYRKHCRLPRWLHQASGIPTMAWRFSIQGSLRDRLFYHATHSRCQRHHLR